MGHDADAGIVAEQLTALLTRERAEEVTRNRVRLVEGGRAGATVIDTERSFSMGRGFLGSPPRGILFDANVDIRPVRACKSFRQALHLAKSIYRRSDGPV